MVHSYYTRSKARAERERSIHENSIGDNKPILDKTSDSIVATPKKKSRKKNVSDIQTKIEITPQKPELLENKAKNAKPKAKSYQCKLPLAVFIGLVLLLVAKLHFSYNHIGTLQTVNYKIFNQFIYEVTEQTNQTSDSMLILTLKSFFRHFNDKKRTDPAILMFIYDDLFGYSKSLCMAEKLARLLSESDRVFDSDYLQEFYADYSIKELSNKEKYNEIRRRVNSEIGTVNVFADLARFPTAVLELFFTLCDHENYGLDNLAFIFTVNVPRGADSGDNDVPESLWDLHEDSRLALNSRIAKNIIDLRPFNENFDVFC